MKVLNKENGFTLMEMIIVLFIFVVFITVMTSILLSSGKITSTIKTQNEMRNASQVAFLHIERTLRENDAKASVNVVNTNGYPSVLDISLVRGAGTITHVFYFYEPSDKKLYMQAAATFDPVDKDSCIVIARQVEEVKYTFDSSKKNLKIELTTNDGIIQTSDKLIFLKAN